MEDSGQPQWRFRRMMPSEINQDPVQGEFFTSASDLPERFVREALQNSLDARRGNQRVHVRFTFSGNSNACSPGTSTRYVSGLAPHIQAVPSSDAVERDALEEALSRLNGPMPWVTVEDFGTTGLDGDIKANDPKEQDNDFWGFFRSIGISPKGEDAGGSWGLGKWVFPDASMINAYLGATRRVGEDRTLLMGMAVLRTHTLNGMKHPPYGYFAAEAGTQDDEWLPLPIDSQITPDFVKQTIIDFRLDRLNSPGLSVIVPYPKKELTPGSIARSVITQYFLPVVRGDLTVEIQAPGERTRTISAETIGNEVVDIEMPATDDAHDEESPESLAGVIRLAKWTMKLDDHAHVTLQVPTSANNSLDLLDLEDLRERYERGDRMAFKIGTRVRQRNSPERTPTSFCLYLERADNLTSGHDYFVRGHLSIPRMDHIKSYKARALVVVDGKSDLGHLLRDSEGPAHVSWDPHAQRLKDRWIGGYQRVQAVRRAAVPILQRLTERPDEQQFDALADLFPADPADIRGRVKSGRRGGYPPPPPPPPPSPPIFTVNRTESGFHVTAQQRDELVGSDWTLRFAYDVVRGNAFSVFEQGARQGVPDFVVRSGQVEVRARSASVNPIADNAVRFRVLNGDFRLDVTGLDYRDMIVDIQRIETSEDTLS